MKIAIFHLSFLYSGGGERLVLEEAIGLANRGHEVTCFVPVVNKKKCFPELINKVKIKTLAPVLPKWIIDKEFISIIFACLFTPFYFFKFKNFDFYFGANQPGPWISYILSKINKKPYAIYLAQPTRLIHPRLIDQQVGLRVSDGFTFLNFTRIIFKPLFNYLDAKSIQGTNLIFVNGSYAKGLLEEIYRIKTINCPAGTHKRVITKNDIRNRSKGRLVLNRNKIEKPYIFLSNRHFPQKKFEYAIEAISLINKNLKLVISGKETSYTKHLKRKYKSKNLKFVGFLSEKQLEEAYKNALIYVYPAPEEDFGMGIIEAMSYGVPVVAWQNGGPTGIIKHKKDGLLARPFSVYDFSENIKKLLNSEKLYESLSRNAIKKTEKVFTYNKHIDIIDRQIKLYSKKVKS